MPGVIISNTSPLQYLHQLGLLDLFPGLYGRVIVPEAVVNELAEGRSRGVGLPDVTILDWVQIRRAEEREFLPRVTHLGQGEREALALGAEMPGCLLVLDDAFARRHARLLGFSFTGTVGVLVDAKRAGLLSAVAPALDKLSELGFRLGPEVRAEALGLVGEAE